MSGIISVPLEEKQMSEEPIKSPWYVLIHALANVVPEGEHAEELERRTKRLEKAFKPTINTTYLAKVVGCDISYVSRILNRRQRPSLTMARKLANVLGVSVEELCDYLGVNGTHELREKYEKRRRASGKRSRAEAGTEAGSRAGAGGRAGSGGPN